MRRPSAPLVIATAALFVALSGGALAAVAIPSNSVGTAQLQHRAVDHDKIGVSAVGAANVAVHQIQVRVGGTCGGWSSISAIGYKGTVTCKRDLPAELGTAGLTVSVPVGSGAGVVADEPLTSGSAYEVTANPSITVQGTNTTPELVAVTCQLQAGSNKASQTATVALTPSIGVGATALPLTITVPQSTTTTTATVACSAASDGGSSTPKVTVSSGINAIQTLKNESYTSAPVVSSPITVSTPTTDTTTVPTTTGTTTTASTPTPTPTG